jgi:CheY-like chemotaxis protein
VFCVLGAYTLKGDKDRYLAAGMDGYVSKPIAVDAMRHEIKGLLSHEFPRKLAA